ncbi:hypothetical protein [Metabacillus malikii]|uniref:Uncharacterized protein n=1 Tax=Metabacillus malikii TaxID=1504265 RepID=A0ABT9ZJF4_9BACI|nr:hypothetical protein [Metabacillus malikii]MDQ0231678.1 hypothetical protein [Metabacillus malikii]
MRQKKLLFAILGIVIGIGIILIYFSKPAPFLTHQQLVKQINENIPDANPETIQDTIFIDDSHVFAPFITEKNEYGISLWEWQHGSWAPIRITTSGEPTVWKIKHNNLSTYRIVWNYHPKDQIQSFAIFYIRERGFSSSSNKEIYLPRIELSHNITVDEGSYGLREIPEFWLPIMDGVKENISYGFMTYNADDHIIFPEETLHGIGYSYGENYEDVRLLDENEIDGVVGE